MSKGPSTDLSGEWTGLFNYPASLPTTHFKAMLRDVSGLISGLTTEEGESLGLSGTVHAVIEGRHDGTAVRFTKVYDDLDHAVHPIHYEGMIAPGGDEIEGEWTIPGHWSGTFLMIRNAGARETVARHAEAEI